MKMMNDMTMYLVAADLPKAWLPKAGRGEQQKRTQTATTLWPVGFVLVFNSITHVG